VKKKIESEKSKYKTFHHSLRSDFTSNEEASGDCCQNWPPQRTQLQKMGGKILTQLKEKRRARGKIVKRFNIR